MSLSNILPFLLILLSCLTGMAIGVAEAVNSVTPMPVEQEYHCVNERTNCWPVEVDV